VTVVHDFTIWLCYQEEKWAVDHNFTIWLCYKEEKVTAVPDFTTLLDCVITYKEEKVTVIHDLTRIFDYGSWSFFMIMLLGGESHCSSWLNWQRDQACCSCWGGPHCERNHWYVITDSTHISSIPQLITRIVSRDFFSFLHYFTANIRFNHNASLFTLLYITMRTWSGLWPIFMPLLVGGLNSRPWASGYGASTG
jgi:hypothetical protein